MSNPTIKVVKRWNARQLNEFLKARLKNIDTYINIITRTQQVNGNSFLDLTAIDFEKWEIPGGPAKEIEMLIKEIQGGKQTSFSSILCHICQ